MTENLIQQRIPERIKQLGYHKYHTRYRDFNIKPFEILSIEAYNELWFVVDDPPAIIIESYYGIYDSTNDYLYDSVHEHRGEISITNPDNEFKRIKLIQVIIVN